jgi:hypothetical protein
MRKQLGLDEDALDVVGRPELEAAGDDMAACLERFLRATADEPTMDRALRALNRWRDVRQPVIGPDPPSSRP